MQANQSVQVVCMLQCAWTVGAPIERDHFSAADRARFTDRLDDQLRALAVVLRRPGFGGGRRTLGVELEMSLVDAEGRAFNIAEEVVREADSGAITPELGNFDIELSTAPVPFEGKPFSAMRRRMERTVTRIADLAGKRGGRAVPIGILPTLRVDDFTPACITGQPRYRALIREMLARRGGDLNIAIEGDDSLHLSSREAITMEGANAAFQIHVSTSPKEFARLYNAALLLTGPVLAASANSPTFLGKRLWHETRVALFKQAGDHRSPRPDADFMLPPRIDFGSGWVREGAHELFLESVALHPPLLAACSPQEDSLGLAHHGEVPELNELRLHHGTVWSWNRPVYDPAGGGNLRIELRALPAGPSYEDMLANACFFVGAMLGLADRMPELTRRLPFPWAKQNFFRGAKYGLDAELAWPSPTRGAPIRSTARDVLLHLLPAAHDGLTEAGVDAHERDHYLGIFTERVRTGLTPAAWQRQTLAHLHERGHRGYGALTELLDRYIAGFESGLPVHAWSLDPRQPSDPGSDEATSSREVCRV